MKIFVSQETRRKMSESKIKAGIKPPSRKGIKWNKKQRETMSKRMKGENNPFYGKHHSLKTRKHWSKIRKGKRKGEENNRWKGGITSENRKARELLEYQEWRNSVYKRDRWTCQHCIKKCKEGNIIAHHIKPFADYPELRLDINNGLTLCRSCHTKYHHKP